MGDPRRRKISGDQHLSKSISLERGMKGEG